MTRNTRNTSNGRFPGGFAPEEDDDLPKSKSQRKRDMTALQDLGVELEALPKDRLARVPMPEALSDAILQARKITSHEGKRRQVLRCLRLLRPQSLQHHRHEPAREGVLLPVPVRPKAFQEDARIREPAWTEAGYAGEASVASCFCDDYCGQCIFSPEFAGSLECPSEPPEQEARTKSDL